MTQQEKDRIAQISEEVKEKLQNIIHEYPEEDRKILRKMMSEHFRDQSRQDRKSLQQEIMDMITLRILRKYFEDPNYRPRGFYGDKMESNAEREARWYRCAVEEALAFSEYILDSAP